MVENQTESVEILINNTSNAHPEASDDEIKIAIDEPPLYKKIKLNNHDAHKVKNENDPERLSTSSSSYIDKHNIKRPIDNHNDKSDDKSDKKEKKEKGKKKGQDSDKKKRKKKENNESCKICRKRTGKMILCDLCPKSFHLECIKMKEEDLPKGKWFCEKCREKRRTEKKKKKEKEGKKAEKTKDKEDKKQTKLEFSESKPEKGEKKKKEKIKDDYDKKMLEFSKKYPQYMTKGKVRFPIEDRLLLLYSVLFQDSSPVGKKPPGKKGFVAPNCLGDILQIWNFFNSFSDLFKFEDIQKEEIFASLKYEGEQSILLLNDMHQGLLSLFLQEFIRKNKFETLREEQEFPLIVLLKHHVGYEDPDSLDGDELALIWTEFARQLPRIPDYAYMFSAQGQQNIEILSEKTALEYNKIEYKTKVKILLDLIECVYETNEFHEFLHSKLEDVTNLVKEKNELLAEIKLEETELYDLKAKVDTESSKQKDNESITQYLSRTESIRKQKENENEKKEQQKNIINIAKLEASISKRQGRIEKINNSLVSTVQTSTLIGLDFYKNEYWVFLHDPNKIYIRNPANQSADETEDCWYYYDTKEEAEALMKALNPKGIREKNLLENLQNMMKNKQIVFDEGKEIKSEKISEENSVKSIEDLNPEQSEPYWLKKVFEYEHAMSNTQTEEVALVRTTRRKAQISKNKVDNEKAAPIKSVKGLSLGSIKEMLFHAEEGLGEYLKKWNSRWARPKAKEEIKNRILVAETIEEMKELLLLLNEKFCSCESLNKIISSMTVDEKKNKVQEEVKNEDDEEFFYDDNHSNDKSKDEEPVKGFPEEDDDEGIRYKRISLRLWGMSNEKFRKCWLNYTQDADNLGSLYFAAMIFCETVNKYVLKKNAAYFSNDRTAKDYYAAKAEKRNKQQLAHLQQPSILKAESYIKPTSVRAPPIERDLDKFKFSTRAHTRSQATGGSGNGGKGQQYREQQYRESDESYAGGDEEEGEDPFEYRYQSTNEKTRSRQDKLNDLVIRRSERNASRNAKKKYEERVWEEECKVCGEYGETPVKCSACPAVFHLDCAGVKGTPEGTWHCVECLEKIASQRQTRSTAKKLGY